MRNCNCEQVIKVMKEGQITGEAVSSLQIKSAQQVFNTKAPRLRPAIKYLHI